MTTSENLETTATFMKLYMFLPSADWRQLHKMVETSDSSVNQCSASNPNGCFNTFIKELSYAYVIIEKRSASSNALVTL